jgi:thioredoxin 2
MSETPLIRCPACGTTNRVAEQKLAMGLTARCGRCKMPLPVPGPAAEAKPLAVTDASFSVEVEQSPVPVLVDAWAAWCHPCRMIAPVIDELASEMAGRVRVAKLNVDENPRTAARFDLRSIPTLLLIKDGREVDRMIGVLPKSEITRRLARFVA